MAEISTAAAMVDGEEDQQREIMPLSRPKSFQLRSPSLNSLRLRRVFDLFDKNSDGEITAGEITEALILLGLDADQSELRSIIATFIKPGFTGLTYPDFESLHKSLNDTFFDSVDQPPAPEDDDDVDDNDHDEKDGGDDDEEEEREKEVIESDLNEAFKVFDQDGDGFISANELQSVLSKLGLPEANHEMRQIQMMISSVDINRDGRVDFLEFKDMMLRSVLAPAAS